METVLAKSDVVSIHLLLNDETRGMITRERIGQMKKGAILVNTARGAVVDEAAMIDALRSGHLRHAGLDVFDIEPLPAGHVLTTTPERDAIGAFCLPHAGGEREPDRRGLEALPADCSLSAANS